jgi:hypothetical protein
MKTKGIVTSEQIRMCKENYGSFLNMPKNVYNEILKVATNVYLNYDPSIHDPTKGATFYHADYVNPGWKLERVKKIGAHIFYRHKRDVKNIGVTV